MRLKVYFPLGLEVLYKPLYTLALVLLSGSSILAEVYLRFRNKNKSESGAIFYRK